MANKDIEWVETSDYFYLKRYPFFRSTIYIRYIKDIPHYVFNERTFHSLDKAKDHAILLIKRDCYKVLSLVGNIPKLIYNNRLPPMIHMYYSTRPKSTEVDISGNYLHMSSRIGYDTNVMAEDVVLNHATKILVRHCTNFFLA